MFVHKQPKSIGCSCTSRLLCTDKLRILGLLGLSYINNLDRLLAWDIEVFFGVCTTWGNQETSSMLQ